MRKIIPILLALGVATCALPARADEKPIRSQIAYSNCMIATAHMLKLTRKELTPKERAQGSFNICFLDYQAFKGETDEVNIGKVHTGLVDFILRGLD